MSITAVKIILIILYILMCLIYALEKRWNQAGAQEICFVLVICLFIPVLGFVFLKIADYVSKHNVSRDYSGIYRGERFHQDELSMLKPLDYEAEVNQVPMKDALKLNEYEYRRKVIMNTLKEENTEEYIQVLKEALENEDPETSHYASTVIMQLRQKITLTCRNMHVIWKKSCTESSTVMCMKKRISENIICSMRKFPINC